MILSPTGIIGPNLQSTLHYVSGRHGVVALILGLNEGRFFDLRSTDDALGGQSAVSHGAFRSRNTVSVSPVTGVMPTVQSGPNKIAGESISILK